MCAMCYDSSANKACVSSCLLLCSNARVTVALMRCLEKVSFFCVLFMTASITLSMVQATSLYVGLFVHRDDLI